MGPFQMIRNSLGISLNKIFYHNDPKVGLYVACPKQGILTNSKWEDKISLLIKKYYFSLTVAIEHQFDTRLNVDKKVVF